jgi:hypothetical protein
MITAGGLTNGQRRGLTGHMTAAGLGPVLGGPARMGLLGHRYSRRRIQASVTQPQIGGR